VRNPTIETNQKHSTLVLLSNNYCLVDFPRFDLGSEVEDMPAMHVQRDDAAQVDRIVMEFVQTHSPTTMDALVRSLVTLSWAQVFSAVDRLSRTHRIQLQQTPHRDYTIRMPDPFICPTFDSSHSCQPCVSEQDV
jgi:hypothetical protein